MLADIPGLIEGAHEGAGLGDRFLGHVERCGVLLHLIDGTEDDVKNSYLTIRHELEKYGDVLSSKVEIVVLNKIDALTPEVIEEKKLELSEIARQDVATISGVSGVGIENTLRDVFSCVTEFRAVTGAAEQSDDNNEPPNDNAFDIIEADDE